MGRHPVKKDRFFANLSSLLVFAIFRQPSFSNPHPKESRCCCTNASELELASFSRLSQGLLYTWTELLC